MTPDMTCHDISPVSLGTSSYAAVAEVFTALFQVSFGGHSTQDSYAVTGSAMGVYLV